MAVQNLKAESGLDSQLRLESERLCSLAASNPHAPAEVLELLANSQSGEVRRRVAENASTPAVVLDTLMHDTVNVRAALASNPKAIERVWSLATDKNPTVRLNLAMNPNLPDHVYQFLAKDLDRNVARTARRTMRKLRQEDSPVASIYRFFAKAS